MKVDTEMIVIGGLALGALYMLYQSAQQETANNDSIVGAIEAVIAAPVQLLEGAANALDGFMNEGAAEAVNTFDTVAPPSYNFGGNTQP